MSDDLEAIVTRYTLFCLGHEAEAWGDAELRKYLSVGGTWPLWVDFKKTFIL
jgi:hypothetical protein